MKGLLIKDLLLLKNQKRIAVLMILVSLFLLFSQDNNGFIISYCTFIAAMLTLNTISYDEFHHGNQFLFTLPFLRKSYAKEKYLLCIGSSLVIWCISTAVCAAVTVFRTASAFRLTDFLLSNGFSLILLVFFLSVLLPLLLKFGNEKARVFLVLFMGIGLGFCVAAESILSQAGAAAEDPLFEILRFLQVHTGAAAALVLTLMIVCCFLSYLISAKIIEKKEF